MILVNLNNTENSVGTGQELQYAVDKGIPVIGFGKQNVYEWLPEDCDVVFDTLEEAFKSWDYVNYYYHEVGKQIYKMKETIHYYDGGYVSGARAMELMMEELNERI